MAKRNLVIVRAGDTSLHPDWLKGGGERNWDIVVSYYGDDPTRYKSPGVTRIDGKGPKWAGLYDLLAANRNLITDYEYIWLPDDDLDTTKEQINKLFDICSQLKLEAVQPSLSWRSYISYEITLRNILTRVRYTNIVETMCPCLSAEMLNKVYPLFKGNISGWGFDFIYEKLARNAQDDIPIIDSVTVRHTRPIGGPNYKHLQAKGITARQECLSFFAAQGIDPEPECRYPQGGTHNRAHNRTEIESTPVAGVFDAGFSTRRLFHPAPEGPPAPPHGRNSMESYLELA